MASYFNTFLFGIYPYIALSVLALGSIVRYDREPYTWRSGSSQLRAAGSSCGARSCSISAFSSFSQATLWAF